MKLIVQIPCLNEASTLPATLAEIPRALIGEARERAALAQMLRLANHLIGRRAS